jgi:hypothetical protein
MSDSDPPLLLAPAGTSSSHPPRLSHVAGYGMYLPPSLRQSCEFRHASSATLRKWEAWSPWAKLDPTAKSTLEGPSAGVGAVFAWSGNNQIGEGRMTITDSRPNELVRFRLETNR